MTRLLYILFLFLLFGCEKVIDVDLNEANPEMVIEGNLSYEKGALVVKISKTASYFESGAGEKVNNAGVFLEHHTGEMIEINETAPGIYEKDRLMIQPGNLYKLRVDVDGEVYTAESFLHDPVKIDSLGYSYSNGNNFFDSGYRVRLYFSDPVGEANYYRIKVSKNGKLENEVGDLIVFDDSAIDGKIIEVTLRGQPFNAGDRARVQLISLDKHAYEYLSTLRDLANTNPGSPAPANPISNFSNGALGYFSAWSHDSKDILIEKR
ncbi:MAG TPA: DUF4249 domain-containing protein [Tangfeifania sp.]|nr:DUF4249 domain-containing protein [Tangfeifania sp.]